MALVLSVLVSVLLVGLVAPAARAAAGTNTLSVGERLSPGDSLYSASGKLRLAMQSDGNLVLYAPGGSARWQSNTDGHAGASAVLQGDGNFVIYSSTGAALWYTHTNGTGTQRAVLQDDGNFVLYTAGNTATWQTATHYYPSKLASGGILRTGQQLQSPNGVYSLKMQVDGNLVLYGPAGAMWNTDTDHTDATHLSVQGDGNAVLYNDAGNWRWQTGTNGVGAVTLDVQDDGNLVLYASTGAVWQSHTYAGSQQPGTTSTRAQTAIRYAQAQIGKPYLWGATGPDSFDCSGLTMRSWEAAGVSIPRTAAQQYAALGTTPFANRQPGDLIFYGSPTVGHVAIYIGNGQMIEAPHDGVPVRQIAVYSGYRAYVGRPA